MTKLYHMFLDIIRCNQCNLRRLEIRDNMEIDRRGIESCYKIIHIARHLDLDDSRIVPSDEVSVSCRRTYRIWLHSMVRVQDSFRRAKTSRSIKDRFLIVFI